MKQSFIFTLLAIVTVPLLSACGNASDHSMDDITSTIEKAGFTCEKIKRHPKTASQASKCRSSEHKYLILTVSEWHDIAARDKMYEKTLPSMCDKVGLKEVRWATSGDWLLVAGGSKKRDTDALDAAAKALGFESHSSPCQ